MQLHIDNELEEFIKPLHEDEFEALVLSMQANGCIEPIIVWNKEDGSVGTIVDGHNRYKICQNFNIPFQTVNIKFTDKLAVMTWMFNKQKGRRNLTPVERLELHSKLKKYASKYAQERMLSGKKLDDICDNNPASRDAGVRKKGKALSKIAKEAGVSTRTAERYDAIQRKGSDEQKEAVRSGQKKIGTVYKEIQAKEKSAAKPQIQSNECDIEKLLKGKTIKTPYLLLYSKKDEETGEEMRTYLSNCEPSANILICRDYMMNVAHGNCPEDDFVQSRIALRRMIDGLVFKEATNAQE